MEQGVLPGESSTIEYGVLTSEDRVVEVHVVEVGPGEVKVECGPRVVMVRLKVCGDGAGDGVAGVEVVVGVFVSGVGVVVLRAVGSAGLFA